MLQKKNIFALTMTASLLIGACSPMIRTHGNMLHEAAIQEIQPMVSSRMDVQETWGPPTTVSSFDPNTWYYIGETTSRTGIFEAEVEKRQVVKVSFADDDRVSDIEIYDGSQALDFEPVAEKTPTAGKEYTAFQQFIGNLGKFNQPVPE